MGLEILDGLSTGLRCSLKRSLSHHLVSPMFGAVVTLYHVNDVFFCVTVDVMSDSSGFICRMECV